MQRGLNLLIVGIALAYLSATESCFTIMDLCFLVDSSASMCSGDPNYKKGNNTCIYWKAILNFMDSVVQNLTIGQDTTRVAMVTYATKGLRQWNCSRGGDPATLISLIDGLAFSAGTTNISGGLDAMMKLVFNQTCACGDNPNAPNVAVVFTGGNATDPSTVQPAVDRAHAAGVTTYAIGLAGDPFTAKQLASDPKQSNQNYFLVDSFLNLNQVLGPLLNQLCSYSC